jgi:hypothetical protein
MSVAVRRRRSRSESKEGITGYSPSGTSSGDLIGMMLRAYRRPVRRWTASLPTGRV